MRLWSSVWLKFLVGAAIFAAFAWTCTQFTDPDLGWHLRVGGWIVAHGSVPRADIYSFTMPGYPWVDHEWAVDAWLWLMRDRGWWNAVVAIFAALAALPFWVWTARAKTWFNHWTVLVGAATAFGFVGVRPQLVSFTLFFLVFEILRARFAAPADRPLPRWYLALPAIFLLWGNLHAGFAAGLFLWGVMLAVHAFERGFREARARLRAMRTDAALLLASAAAVLANPYGIGIYREVVQVALSAETHRYIEEWQPALAIQSFLTWLFIIVLSSAGFLLVRYFRRYAWMGKGTALVFMLLFLRSARMFLPFLVVMMPLFERGEAFAREEVGAAWARAAPTRGVRRATKAFVVFLIVILAGGWYLALAKTQYESPPSAAIQYVRSLAAQGTLGPLYNTYGWGGYLIAAAPEIKVFIDGRMPHWADAQGYSAMRDVVAVQFGDAGAWQEVFRRWQIRTVLIRNTPDAPAPPPSPYPGLAAWWRTSTTGQALNRLLFGEAAQDLRRLLIAHHWRVAYEDSQAVVLACDADCY